MGTSGMTQKAASATGEGAEELSSAHESLREDAFSFKPSFLIDNRDLADSLGAHKPSCIENSFILPDADYLRTHDVAHAELV